MEKIDELMKNMDLGKPSMLDNANGPADSDSDDVLESMDSYTKSLDQINKDKQEPTVARPTTIPTDKSRKLQKEKNSYTFWKEQDKEKLASF